jgi:hypothetical protein
MLWGEVMGKMSRDKGSLFERVLVKILQGRGFAAERVPLSGGAGGRFSGDIDLPYLGADHRWECKIRAGGFREIYKWIEGHSGLFIRADRKPALVVLRLDDFLDLIEMAEEKRAKKEAA